MQAENPEWNGIDDLVEERGLAVPGDRRLTRREGGSIEVRPEDVLEPGDVEVVDLGPVETGPRALGEPTDETLDDVLGRPKRRGRKAGPRANGHEPSAANVELPDMPERPDPEAPDGSVWGEVEDADRKRRVVYPVPQDASFDEDSVIDAGDLTRLALRLIGEVPAFRSLPTLTIRYYWKRRGGSKEAVVRKADEFLGHEAGADVVVWLAADTLRRRGATEWYVEALLFDCLSRIDAPKHCVSPPDLEVNVGTVRRYGFWTADLRTFRHVAVDALARERQTGGDE